MIRVFCVLVDAAAVGATDDAEATGAVAAGTVIAAVA
jgi:hypothetical protein